jgi:hypothetical protein
MQRTGEVGRNLVQPGEVVGTASAYQAIEDRDGSAACQEALRQVAADETGPTSNEDSLCHKSICLG